MEARGIEPKELVSASRKLSRAAAEDLTREATRIVVAKGKNVSEFRASQDRGEAVEAMLGPTGNLRAPTIRVGKTLVVGFNEEVFEDLLE